MKSVFIYALACPITMEVKYIGQTKNLRSRLSHHLSEIGSTPKNIWISALRIEGLKPLIILLETSNVVKGNADEKKWIRVFSGSNLFNSKTYIPRAYNFDYKKVSISTETYISWKSKCRRGDLLKISELLNVKPSKVKSIIEFRKGTPLQIDTISTFYSNA